MPKRGSPNRAIRLEDLGLWDEFGQLAEPDRSAILRDFMAWYVGRPGAKLPQRPGRMDDTDQDSVRTHSAA